MEKLKDLYYGKATFKQLAKDIKAVYPDVDEKQFYKDGIRNLETLELKDRIKRIAETLHTHLPQNYKQALKILYAYCKGRENNFYYLFVPTFIMLYGQHDYKTSMQALKDLTSFSSSEEAIRPFIAQDVKGSLKLIQTWTTSKDYHVRRLCSEGTRPRLPWAKQIPEFIQKPKLTWPILEKLNKDPEKYVQKSVANHINDMSKDHGDWVVKQLSKWDQNHPVTKWIVKHGLRTLIKQGHQPALKLLGYGNLPLIKIKNFQLSKKCITMGNTLAFSFDIHSQSDTLQNLIVDYAIHFVKKSGKVFPKVFKGKQISLSPQTSCQFQNTYTFKDMSTRKHYAGMHKIEIFINGLSIKGGNFELNN